MKKYTVAVRTIENPLPRFCDFRKTGDVYGNMVLKSETMLVIVSPDQLENIFRKNQVLTPNRCKVFLENPTAPYIQIAPDVMDFSEWTPERIKGAFRSGNGTTGDLLQYVETNRPFVIILDTETGTIL